LNNDPNAPLHIKCRTWDKLQNIHPGSGVMIYLRNIKWVKEV
jgi:hypothetical protein